MAHRGKPPCRYWLHNIHVTGDELFSALRGDSGARHEKARLFVMSVMSGICETLTSTRVAWCTMPIALLSRFFLHAVAQSLLPPQQRMLSLVSVKVSKAIIAEIVCIGGSVTKTERRGTFPLPKPSSSTRKGPRRISHTPTHTPPSSPALSPDRSRTSTPKRSPESEHQGNERETAKTDATKKLGAKRACWKLCDCVYLIPR